MHVLVMWLLLIRTPQQVWYVFGNYQTKADCEEQRRDPGLQDLVRNEYVGCVQVSVKVR